MRIWIDHEEVDARDVKWRSEESSSVVAWIIIAAGVIAMYWWGSLWL